jgi:hypothetical protein
VPRLDHQSLIGAKFGQLTILEVGSRVGRQRMVTCGCDCGRKTSLRLSRLREAQRTGRPIGCGCLRGKWFRHNDSRSRLYRVWEHMLRRCNKPNNRAYASYGGRGIKVCNEWHDYLVFRNWAKTSGYQEGLSIDRINNDAGYCPENCRWATAKEQMNNRRVCVFIEHQGKRQTLTQWSEELGIPVWRVRAYFGIAA